MQVYVAASSQEMDYAREIMDEFEARGHTVYDWTAEIKKEGTSNGGLSRKKAVRYAVNDLNAVEHSEVFVLLAPATATVGAWVEYGYALSQSIPTFILGENASIFARLSPSGDEEELWRWLAEYKS